MSDAPSLDELAARLEEIAGRLREGAVEPDEAAGLVEQCAELAAALGAEVDAQARRAGEAEGQERLL
jgi:hypothetical protein